MQTKHPSIVSFPGEYYFLFLCILLVHWTVQVNKDGAVKPSINLLPKIPQNTLQLFQTSPISGAAGAFHSLQRILGVEGALEAVVKAMTVELLCTFCKYGNCHHSNNYL
uniref:Uncharacterized protein n=1 Tax=Periophthalmus magnuspinnatus TaxID=409849 RepID=A0A3B4AWY2_9GOBI